MKYAITLGLCTVVGALYGALVPWPYNVVLSLITGFVIGGVVSLLEEHKGEK